ncbi:MAG: hypothetical protein C5B54_03170, partial [Acidobacteria bacterium]
MSAMLDITLAVWQPHRTRTGSPAWRNAQTGEIRYQKERPGEPGQGAPQPGAPRPGPAPQRPKTPPVRPPANQQQLIQKMGGEAYRRMVNDPMQELQGVHMRMNAPNIPRQITDRFDAHGTQTIQTLAALLNGGIQKDRSFYSAPLTSAYHPELGYGDAVRDNSSFVILSHPDQKLIDGGLPAVMVDPLYEPMIPDLKAAFPGIKFFSVKRAPEILSHVASAQGRHSPAPGGKLSLAEPVLPNLTSLYFTLLGRALEETEDVDEALQAVDIALAVGKYSPDWRPYRGAGGGRGWQNIKTGEIRYQREPPLARQG